MPSTEYESRTDSVLAWKKAQKLGRFDPDAPSIEQQKILASEREVEERGKLVFVHEANDVRSYVLGSPISDWLPSFQNSTALLHKLDA